MPPAIAADDPSRADWIGFGRPGHLIQERGELSLRHVKPEEGLLVLFPSYIYHCTVPFEDEQKRICIAFDTVPSEKPA